ncbi:Holliday junction branch migration protein RuvA [Ectobacillus antri]|uniref:Holliday junction branch migration complex subunit RuvA n=1 Tax=Ectobacillus antri TaxID=2486280 RepID=A0ABT6H169_9BACI|nr:Holliday junction branch migration protein RuvA [Ectobacillus antri]MDG4655391.1 Holliday junction branch migration protein RuvA [Ectobacillus antri]MDG5753149.1 Holliday junction branch migration protein RuvA [Ectobacillus antri]
MFEYITGSVEFVGPEYIVLDHNGIGYQLLTPNPYMFRKSEQQIRVYTYQYVREDILALYGFQSREERALFMKLISVSGIGPKGALAILAAGQTKQVVQAVEQEDEKFLVKFPGVGKKTARQMILDLKGKLNDLVPDALPDLFSAPDAFEKSERVSVELDEALEALKALGYAEREIARVVPDLIKEALSTDQYIKKALQLLLNGKR